jgi:hypothetical protein
MENQSQYQVYLKKIKEVGRHDSAEKLIKQLNGKADYMLTYMREHMAASDFNQMKLIFIIPFLILSLLSCLVFGGFWRIVPLILAAAYILFCRHQAIQLHKTESFKPLAEDETINSLSYVESKVNHVQYGIEVKRHRILEIKYLYIFFFPFFLYLTTEFLIRSTPFNQFWIGLIIAFIVGVIAWQMMFSEDLDELQYYEESLESDLIVLKNKV